MKDNEIIVRRQKASQAGFWTIGGPVLRLSWSTNEFLRLHLVKREENGSKKANQPVRFVDSAQSG